jgi:hypothetical protein
MKKKFVLCTLILISSSASAATGKQAFNCEQIKEKSARESCIQWKTDLEKQKETKANTDALSVSQKDKTVDDPELKEMNEFVSKAKAILTANYKDPESVQFKDLIVAKTIISRALCGSVNAKNSYGGYIGFKNFYISFDKFPGSRPQIWYEGESTKSNDWNNTVQYESGMKLKEIEAKIQKMNCGPDEGIEVIQVQ